MKKFAIPLLLCLFACQPGAPTKTAESFYKDACEGKIETKKYLSSQIPPNLSSKFPSGETVLDLFFQGFGNRCKAKGGFRELKTTEKYEKDYTLVVGDVVFNDSSKESISMKLRQESGEWKIIWQGFNGQDSVFDKNK